MNEPVKRWRTRVDIGADNVPEFSMQIVEDGQFVLASDYDVLEARCREAETHDKMLDGKLTEMRYERDDLRQAFNEMVSTADAQRIRAEYVENKYDQISERLTRIERAAQALCDWRSDGHLGDGIQIRDLRAVLTRGPKS